MQLSICVCTCVTRTCLQTATRYASFAQWKLQVQQERSRVVNAEARSHALAEELTAARRDRDAAQASLCDSPLQHLSGLRAQAV